MTTLNFFRPNIIKLCREWGQKLGSDETTTCFGDKRHTESGGPTSQGEGTPRSRTGMCQPLSITQEPPSCFLGLSLRVVSVVIYSSLPFILLLHLSIIHASPQVHVPSAILSGALWATVAPIALSRGYIHIKGGQGVSYMYLIRRWQLSLGLPPHLFPYG